jgi:hypothetical protein
MAPGAIALPLTPPAAAILPVATAPEELAPTVPGVITLPPAAAGWAGTAQLALATPVAHRPDPPQAAKLRALIDAGEAAPEAIEAFRQLAARLGLAPVAVPAALDADAEMRDEVEPDRKGDIDPELLDLLDHAGEVQAAAIAENEAQDRASPTAEQRADIAAMSAKLDAMAAERAAKVPTPERQRDVHVDALKKQLQLMDAAAM